jgi:hypothetical protein
MEKSLKVKHSTNSIDDMMPMEIKLSQLPLWTEIPSNGEYINVKSYELDLLADNSTTTELEKLEWKPSSFLTLDMLESSKGTDRVKIGKIYYDSTKNFFVKLVQKTDVAGEWKAE